MLYTSMKNTYLTVSVVLNLLVFAKPVVSEPQAFFQMATGNEAVLIENSDFSKVNELASKAVVDVQTESIKNIFLQDPFFKRFFQMIDPRSGKPLHEITKSSGSAVIISEDGYLLTCGHVVNRMDKIIIHMQDNRKFTAKIVAHYPEIDLAILKIEKLGDIKLPFLKIGSAKDIKSGMPVAALGNALNLGPTFTNGIISAPKRRLPNPTDGSSFVVLQHNVAVNPGNSGGALVDKRGNLVGINNAMLSKASAIGFSISIEVIGEYLNKFTKKIEGAWFGVYDLKPLTQEAVDSLYDAGFRYRGGLFVSKVNNATPVKAAGLQEKDIILSINGRPIEMVEDLRLRETLIEAKTSVEMKVWRDKKELKLTVIPVARPKIEEVKGVILTGNHFFAGIKILQVTPEVAEKLKIPSETKGLVVLNDLPGEMSSIIGGGLIVQKGDLLLKMNETKLEKPTDLQRALEKITPSAAFDLLLIRKGQQIQLAFNGSMNQNKTPMFGQMESEHSNQQDASGKTPQVAQAIPNDFLKQFQEFLNGSHEDKTNIQQGSFSEYQHAVTGADKDQGVVSELSEETDKNTSYMT